MKILIHRKFCDHFGTFKQYGERAINPFLWVISEGREGEVLELSQINDIKRGELPRDTRKDIIIIIIIIRIIQCLEPPSLLAAPAPGLPIMAAPVPASAQATAINLKN